MKMPLLFIGHGSPMNALETNTYTDSWKKIGESITHRPRAILMLSAHWITEWEMRVNMTETPEMIYDMYGFPEELYRVRYDSLWSSDFATEIIRELAGKNAIIWDISHWLDHGAWSTLIHLFPEADIPVIQMSLDYSKSPLWHYEFGKKLKTLREKGILIIGSGNIVHNLRAIDWTGKEQYPWAIEFDRRVSADIQEGNHEDILNFHNWWDISRLAQPSHDHLLPLIPMLGAIDESDIVEFFTPDIAMGSLSMRSIAWR